MSNAIIDYNFGVQPLANPDASMPAQAVNCTAAAGPGNAAIGIYPTALNLPGSAYITTQLPIESSIKKFAARIVLKAAVPFTGRQTLLAANGFSLYLKKSDKENECILLATITDTTGVFDTTPALVNLKADEWYLLDIVFDTDTWALFADDMLIALLALSGKKLATTADNSLVIGADRQSFQNKFTGTIAALKIYKDEIPEELENKLDALRITAAWFISKKYNQLKNKISFGAPVGTVTYNAQLQTYTQQYEKGQIAYNAILGNAVEIHGSIYKYYQPLLKKYLGTPVTDELPGKKNGSRKNAFANGSIYWSAQTGAFPVMNNMYLYYERIGESKSVLGLPVDTEKTITGGNEQKFEGGVLMLNRATKDVFEVPTNFVTAFKAAGGVAKLGFPVSGFNNILNASRQSIGKQCAFEKAVFYSSAATGIHYIPEGRISAAYLQHGGVKGSFGFPTADPRFIIISSKKYTCCTFQGGAMIDNGSTVLFREPFRMSFNTVATEETEAPGRGSNDLYMYLTVQENGTQVVKKRFPESGSYSGRNIVTGLGYNTPSNFIINNPDKKIHIELDVWEEDSFNDDDHPGTMKKDLTINNLWGLLEAPEDLFNSGPYGGIQYVTWSIKPQVTPGTNASFWDIVPDHNPKTPEISRAQFAEAFRDIDSEPEWYDVSDWLKKLYMEIAKGVASTGNCSGFCTEAIYARKDLSPFSIPLSKYHTWETVRNEINVKQCYQAGDSSLRWFVGEFIKGNTSNPKEVFSQTKACFDRGDNPILCVAENYFSGGSKHCLLPVTWDSSTKPWKIGVFDPNASPSSLFYVKINPDNNTYAYQRTANSTNFTGRMTYMPWSRICHTPRTPLLEILVLLGGLLGGGIVGAGALLLLLAGSSAETESLTDASGNNLDALKETGGNYSGKFLPFYGLEGKAALNGEIITNLPGQFNLNDIHHKLKGASNGKFQYGIKQAMNEFGIESTITKTEINQVKTEKLAKADQMIKFVSPKNKLVNFITHKNLGGNDTISIAVNNVPVRSGLDLNFHASAGMNYIDILHGDNMPGMEISIESKISNQIQKKTYRGGSEVGSRIFLSNAIDSDSLKIGSISQIGGSSNKSIFLTKQ